MEDEEEQLMVPDERLGLPGEILRYLVAVFSVELDNWLLVTPDHLHLSWEQQTQMILKQKYQEAASSVEMDQL